MTSIIAFIIGLSFGAIFIACAYIIGRTNGWNDGFKAGSDVAINAIAETKAIVDNFKREIDAFILG